MKLLAGPEIAIFHRFRRPPYGGSNQFLLALRAELERRGHDVGANRIGRATRAALLNSYLFDERRLRPGPRVVHRLDGPLLRYRGFDDGTDARIVELNARHADATVFQSRYSLAAHRDLGLEVRDPVVIPNAVDAGIFHPGEARQPAGRPRLIVTSWSDNPNKGGSTLAWLDRNLDWSRYECTFVGRSSVRYERIRMVEAVGSMRLAELLREHDVYLAPSRNDPASNALLEALACGLPAVHHASGGHGEIAGAAGLPFDDDEEVPGLLERIVDELVERRAAIAVPPIGDVAARYLETLGLVP
jgi:glycosyltransferase involved in cell wall biosynthesis